MIFSTFRSRQDKVCIRLAATTEGFSSLDIGTSVAVPLTLILIGQHISSPDYSSQQFAAPATLQTKETGDVDRKRQAHPLSVFHRTPMYSPLSKVIWFYPSIPVCHIPGIIYLNCTHREKHEFGVAERSYQSGCP